MQEILMVPKQVLFLYKKLLFYVFGFEGKICYFFSSCLRL